MFLLLKFFLFRVIFLKKNHPAHSAPLYHTAPGPAPRRPRTITRRPPNTKDSATTSCATRYTPHSTHHALHAAKRTIQHRAELLAHGTQHTAITQHSAHNTTKYIAHDKQHTAHHTRHGHLLLLCAMC